MVAPESMALVIRQRGGPNLITHTSGISGNLVHRACEEAVTIMGRFALGRDQTDVDGSGDIHPRFSHDKLVVLSERYVVVYRLVFKIWVMAVVPNQASSLVALRLVEAATKGLVTTCQVLEVDNEVIRRNYQEVHFMMEATLKHRGANMQMAQTEALANIYSYMADSRDKKGRSTTDSSRRISVQRSGKQRLSEVYSGAQNFTFQLPEDFRRLRSSDPKPVPSPLPLESLTLFKPEPTTDPVPFTMNDVMPSITKPVTQEFKTVTPAPVIDGFDDFFKTPTPQPVVSSNTSLDIFSQLSTPAPPPAPAVTQTTLTESSAWLNFEPTPTPLAIPSPIHSIPPSGPSPLLYLREKWEGEFEGRKCVSSIAFGEVGLRKQIWKQSSGKDIRFRFTPPSTNENNRIHKAMKCIQSNPSRTTVLKQGLFSAKVQPARTPYIKYRLFPGVYDPPIRVTVTSAWHEFGKVPHCLVLLVHVSTNPRNKSITDGTIYAWVPAPFGPPKSARPKPKHEILFRAILPAADSVDEDLASSIRVTMHCIGRPGTTFSGMGLSQELSPGAETLSDTPATSVWSAYVTARP